ncbi:MAG: biotin--[acetyl-CoA-carboxylase] ligase [Candidatus Margulisiibacteriota bacterium]
MPPSIDRPTIIIGKKIFRYPIIDSTNDEARRLIEKGEGEGVVVQAEAQAKGKGKPGRNWYSAPGQGIYLSAVVKPRKNPREIASITLIGARAVVKILKDVAGVEAEIKLPNDVMINGKKIAGILVERLDSGYIIIGIGVNLNQLAGSFPSDITGTATSVKIETGRDFGALQTADRLIAALNNEYLAYLQLI